MGTLATNLLATARRLTKSYGQSVSFDRVVEGAFVPSTGAVGAGTHTTYTAFGAPIPTADKEINGTTILQSDIMLWLEANSANYVPKVGDVAALNGNHWRILAVTNFVVQSVTLLYKLQLRI